jgi:hypothetical protein
VCKTWNPLQLTQTLRLTLTHAAIAMLSSALELPPTPAIWLAGRPIVLNLRKSVMSFVSNVMYQHHKCKGKHTVHGWSKLICIYMSHVKKYRLKTDPFGLN